MPVAMTGFRQTLRWPQYSPEESRYLKGSNHTKSGWSDLT